MLLQYYQLAASITDICVASWFEDGVNWRLSLVDVDKLLSSESAEKLVAITQIYYTYV